MKNEVHLKHYKLRKICVARLSRGNLVVLRVGAFYCVKYIELQKLTRLKATEILSMKVRLVRIKSICPLDTHSIVLSIVLK